MYDTDIHDTDNTDNTVTSTRSLNDTEYAEFRRWKDSKIMEAGIAQGRAQASAEHQAAEAAADAAALQKLTSKGHTLKDAFGNSATAPGRNALIQLQRSSFSSRSGDYARLRRMAQAEGLVK